MDDNNRLDDFSGEEETFYVPAEETEELIYTAEETEEFAEAEETEEEPADDEEDGEELCLRCGVDSAVKGHDYCMDCLLGMLSVKISWKAWLAGIASLFVTIVGLVLFFINFSSAFDVAKGDYYAMKKCWQSAYNCYSDASTAADTINSSFGTYTPVRLGERVAVRMIKATAHTESPVMAGHVIKSQYPALEGKYSSLAPYEKEYKTFADTYSDLQKTLEPYYNGEISFNDALNEIEQTVSQDESIDRTYAYYILSDMAGYTGEDNANIISLLKKIEEIAPEKTWIYAQILCSISLSEGDYEQCARYNNIALGFNAQDTQMNYVALMLAMNEDDRSKAERICEKYKENMGEDEYYFAMKAATERRFGSLEKARAIVDEGLEQWSSSPEIMRQESIINLLEGDYKAAYESVFNAYNSAYQYYYYYGEDLYTTQQLNDTLFLMAELYKAHGGDKDENAESIENILSSHEENGIEDSPDVGKIIRGKLTPENVFLKGDGDIL